GGRVRTGALTTPWPPATRWRPGTRHRAGTTRRWSMVLHPEARSPSPVLHARHAPDGARRPDPVRIVGLCGALLLNGAALMLMLVPLGRPATAPEPPGGIEAEWFEPRPVPPPPPPQIAPVVPPATPA